MSESPHEELDPLRIEQMLANAGEQLRMGEQLANRMSVVERHMDAYAGTFDQMHRLLDLAEERAREIEHTAQIEAARMRVELHQHVETVLSELDSKIDRKKDALRQLSMLEFGMTQRVERARVPPNEQAQAPSIPTTHVSAPAVIESEAMESSDTQSAQEEDRSLGGDVIA